MSAFTTNSGVSPPFSVSGEGLVIQYRTAVTRISIDGVEPPVVTPEGVSEAMRLTNRWSPWIDEKLAAPRYDGVSRYLGTPSNRPSMIKDYHLIALCRAVDYVLRPRFVAYIKAEVDSPTPTPPPIFDEDHPDYSG
jgi:hypothetical protein